MADTSTLQPATSTLTLYRELFNQLVLSTLDSSQFLDLAALSGEQAKGLCHGLMLLVTLCKRTHDPMTPNGNS